MDSVLFEFVETPNHKLCSVDGCGTAILAKGFCVKHYARNRSTGSPFGIRKNGRPARGYKKCIIAGCDGNMTTKGFCAAHYQRSLKHGNPETGGAMRKRGWAVECSIEDCQGPSIAVGLCSKHYGRRNRHGDPHFTSAWYKKRFEKIINEQGYVEVYAPDHPNANNDGRVPEHRYVMSGIIGRALLETESVHHRNGVKTDNDPKNLELWVTKQPRGQRPPDLVEWAREILSLYPDSLLAQLESETSTSSRGVGSQ